MINKELIETIKKELLEKKANLEERLKNFAHKSGKAKDDYDADFPQFGESEDENAAEVAAYEDALSVERTLEKSLQDVKKTLARIEKGEYGKCQYCGKDIGEKRLLARPVSSACVQCKERLSRG